MNDRDPPQAASASLPETEAQLDPVVVGAQAQRRGRATAADGGCTHVVATTSTLIVDPRLGSSRREGEQEQHEGERTTHLPSVRS